MKLKTPKFLEDLEEETLRAEALVEHGTVEELRSYLIERGNRPDYLKAVASRDRLKAAHEATNELWKSLNEDYTKSILEDRPYAGDYEEVRYHGRRALNLHANKVNLIRLLGEYKNVHARVAAKLEELLDAQQIEAGEYASYEEPTLNRLVRTGDYPSGSREWLEARQGGVGGSDVGKILKVDKQYGDENFKETLASKVLPVTDEQVALQTSGQSNYTDAASRGNAWEGMIGQLFRESNPELQLIHCKASWARGDDPTMRMNFDFLLSKTRGDLKPTGLLEIKTSAFPEKWGPSGGNLDDVPPEYRAQVLHCAYHGELSWGAIGVLIDDHDYREYFFEMNSELLEEAQRNYEASQKFMERVARIRAGAEPLERSRIYKGFAKLIQQGGKGGHEARMSCFRDISALQRKDVATVERNFYSFWDAKSKDRGPAEKLMQEFYELGIKDLLASGETIVATDIETSGITPTRGQIIELGISTRDKNRKEIFKLEELYGVDEVQAANGGTGMVDVHGITLEDVAGKRPFSHPRVQKRVLKRLLEGVLMVHNKTFELGWFRQHLNGFAEAELAGKVRVIDTMQLVKKFMPQAVNNKLQSFVEFNGMEYVDAHRAYNDTVMMVEAYYRFIDNFEYHISHYEADDYYRLGDHYEELSERRALLKLNSALELKVQKLKGLNFSIGHGERTEEELSDLERLRSTLEPEVEGLEAAVEDLQNAWEIKRPSFAAAAVK